MWTSRTQQFDADEMGSLESTAADQLAPMLMRSGQVVALRALAEIMLNGGDAKLAELLRDRDLGVYWLSYRTDHGVDHRDHEYARQLRARHQRG